MYDHLEQPIKEKLNKVKNVNNVTLINNENASVWFIKIVGSVFEFDLRQFIWQ